MPAPPRLRLLLAALAVVSGGAAAAQTAPPSKTGALARLGGGLQQVAVARTDREVARAARTAGLHVQGGLVAVDVAATDGDGAALLARLEGLGLRDGVAYRGLVSGRLPVSALGALAALDGVQSARAVLGVTHSARRAAARAGAGRGRAGRVGAVDGEAARALRVQAVRQQLGVDGSGIRMGVLSDSYDACARQDNTPDACVTTAADDVASGDLPDGGARVLRELPATDGRGGAVAGSDEGRAMMQLAYDVAPGLEFSFYTAFLGQAAFARGILDLAAAGADVVVDDVLLFAEPFFQDGVIAQAVTEVVAGGVAYFSSAGNQADDAFQQDFDDSGLEAQFVVRDETGAPVEGADGEPFVFDGALHDFDPGPAVDAFQDVTVGPGETVTLVFQYAEPSFSASTGGRGATSDYDVYLVDRPAPDATALSLSVDNNDVTSVNEAGERVGSGEPVEILGYSNDTDQTQTVYLAVVKFSGDDRFFKYIEFDGQAEFEYAQEGNATSVAHNNAAAAMSVAAAAWFNTPPFNPNIRQPVLNSFTSFGGSLVLFDDAGNRLTTPEDRMKPDVTGSDGDNNTFFGFDLPESLDADTFPNFFGTSAAAPNVAAVAALMLEAAGGPRALAPADVYRILEETADDVTPFASSSGTANAGTAPGYDPRSGFGFVRGDRALTEAAALGVGELTEDGPFRLRGPFPNPVRDDLRFVFVADQTQDVSVTLYDVRGRRVATAFEGAVQADRVRRVELDVGGLASGVYVLRLEGAEGGVSRVVTVLR